MSARTAYSTDEDVYRLRLKEPWLNAPDYREDGPQTQRPEYESRDKDLAGEIRTYRDAKGCACKLSACTHFAQALRASTRGTSQLVIGAIHVSMCLDADDVAAIPVGTLVRAVDYDRDLIGPQRVSGAGCDVVSFPGGLKSAPGYKPYRALMTHQPVIELDIGARARTTWHGRLVEVRRIPPLSKYRGDPIVCLDILFVDEAKEEEEKRKAWYDEDDAPPKPEVLPPNSKLAGRYRGGKRLLRTPNIGLTPIDVSTIDGACFYQAVWYVLFRQRSKVFHVDVLIANLNRLAAESNSTTRYHRHGVTRDELQEAIVLMGIPTMLHIYGKTGWITETFGGPVPTEMTLIVDESTDPRHVYNVVTPPNTLLPCSRHIIPAPGAPPPPAPRPFPLPDEVRHMLVYNLASCSAALTLEEATKHVRSAMSRADDTDKAKYVGIEHRIYQEAAAIRRRCAENKTVENRESFYNVLRAAGLGMIADEVEHLRPGLESGASQVWHAIKCWVRGEALYGDPKDPGRETSVESASEATPSLVSASDAETDRSPDPGDSDSEASGDLPNVPTHALNTDDTTQSSGTNGNAQERESARARARSSTNARTRRKTRTIKKRDPDARDHKSSSAKYGGWLSSNLPRFEVPWFVPTTWRDLVFAIVCVWAAIVWGPALIRLICLAIWYAVFDYGWQWVKVALGIGVTVDALNWRAGKPLVTPSVVVLAAKSVWMVSIDIGCQVGWFATVSPKKDVNSPEVQSRRATQRVAVSATGAKPCSSGTLQSNQSRHGGSDVPGSWLMQSWLHIQDRLSTTMNGCRAGLQASSELLSGACYTMSSTFATALHSLSGAVNTKKSKFLDLYRSTATTPRKPSSQSSTSARKKRFSKSSAATKAMGSNAHRVFSLLALQAGLQRTSLTGLSATLKPPGTMSATPSGGTQASNGYTTTAKCPSSGSSARNSRSPSRSRSRSAGEPRALVDTRRPSPTPAAVQSSPDTTTQQAETPSSTPASQPQPSLLAGYAQTFSSWATTCSQLFGVRKYQSEWQSTRNLSGSDPNIKSITMSRQPPSALATFSTTGIESCSSQISGATFVDYSGQSTPSARGISLSTSTTSRRACSQPTQTTPGTGRGSVICELQEQLRSLINTNIGDPPLMKDSTTVRLSAADMISIVEAEMESRRSLSEFPELAGSGASVYDLLLRGILRALRQELEHETRSYDRRNAYRKERNTVNTGDVGAGT